MASSMEAVLQSASMSPRGGESVPFWSSSCTKDSTLVECKHVTWEGIKACFWQT